MNFRSRLKIWVYDGCPGVRGRFRYFGSTVYFPQGSVIFRAACWEGVFEKGNTMALERLARPKTWFFDVGANIGLMSIPVLRAVPDLRVVSFEPSPSVLPHLCRTVRESAWADRWQIVAKAVGATDGRVAFSVSKGADGTFDGMRVTARGKAGREVEVDVTTLDAEWSRLGKPSVSLIKLDIEGAEAEALRGAEQLLRAQRPAVLVEWNEANFSAYGVRREDLLRLAADLGYRVHAMPSMVRVETGVELSVHMGFTESFLMLHAE